MCKGKKKKKKRRKKGCKSDRINHAKHQRGGKKRKAAKTYEKRFFLPVSKSRVDCARAITTLPPLHTSLHRPLHLLSSLHLSRLSIHRHIDVHPVHPDAIDRSPESYSRPLVPRRDTTLHRHPHLCVVHVDHRVSRHHL